MFSLKKVLVKIIKPISSNKYTYYLFSKIYRFSLFGFFGDEWDFTRNGEVGVLKFLRNRLKGAVVVFDVGANEGSYTEVLLSTFESSSFKLTIHGFEPAAETFARYSARFKETQQVISNHVGLSDSNQVLRLYKSATSTGFSSLYESNKFNFNSFEDITLTTIDQYCHKNGVEVIDFLKIDVEGHEMSVLRGSGNMLQSGKIKVIQFEFGTGNISSKTFFKDFYDLLGDNFVFYRIVKNGLMVVEKYEYSMEVFGRVTNYLAVRKSLKW